MIKRFYILLLAIVASVGMSWATDPIVIATNTEQSSYTQGSITVSVNNVGDSDGFRLNSSNSASISNSGSSTISKIELVPGWFKNKHSNVRANGAAPNSSSEELITFLNVNSNDVTLSCSVSICIKEVRIYFEEAGGGDAPVGALKGKFSVADGKFVCFSKGNLQYTKSTGKFEFMSNQYDMAETFNQNVGDDYANQGVISLVGWATSGISRTGVNAYQPYSTYHDDAYYGTTSTKSASETLGDYDWGKNMGDGWRTLTAEEWGYLIGPGNGGPTPSDQRANYQSLRGLCKITVSGTEYPGMIILPDDLYDNLPTEGDIASKWAACAVAAGSLNYTLATFTEEEWTALQAAGAVFLPAAGYRNGTTVIYLGTGGYYWSSSASLSTNAFYLYFGPSKLKPNNSSQRCNGNSVRLVSDIAPAAPAWVKAGDVWDEDTKTLTVNSNPGNEAYYQNTEIKHLIISDGVTTIGESAFDECTALLSVVIGNDVTNIEAYAFDECRAMTSLTIGNKVQTIGESAFGSCESLTSVIIPNSVTSIGESAFDTCDKISSLTIGNSVQSIGEDAFTNCSALTDVTIPASVENIGAWFFRNCENLATITCEATTPPTLGNNAFFDCDKLEHIYVPAASVATYKAATNWATKEAIISAIQTNQLYMEVDGTAGTLKWGLAGSNPVYDGNAIQYSDRKYITTLTIDASCQNHTLTSFYNLFYVFSGLTTINGLENLATANVESMRYMFYDCKALTSLDLSSFNTAKVTDMKGMFNGCSNLTTIYVGDGWNTSAVTNGSAMFYGCTNLPNYDSEATGVDKAYVGAGGYLSANLTPADVMALINAIGTVEFTAECKAKIDAARTAYDALSDGDKAQVTNIATLTTAEAAFDNVMDIWLSGDCDAILWKDTTLTIRKHAGEGNGAMADYTDYYGDNTAPWFNSHWYNPQPNDIVIKSVKIEEGVTRIGDYAFGWMSELKTLTIPSSVTSIGEDAFYWSKAVDDIYLTVANPSNLTWVLPYSADNQFKPEKATRCHVPADLLTAYQETFGTLNMTFVGDLDPITPLTPEQQQALDAAKDKIAAIPSPVVYTPACKDAIDAARAAYDALTPDMLKQLVSNYATLTAAEATYANLKDVVVVEAKINAIPQPVTLKLATRDSIESARAAYDALTADQKLLVSNYDVLTTAEAALAGLNPGGGAPAGALNGKFTINADGDQIAFSKGNLQYQASTTTLRFATNQYDMIGADNANISDTYTGWIDLFGWGTGNNPAKASTVDGDYSTFTDWGTNAISNGGNEANLWRTMTVQEWNHLIKNRTNAAHLKGQATVADVHGYVLLPDSWTLPAGLSFTANPNNWTTNDYTAEQWAQMEAAGAVFLPAAGYREPEIEGVGEKGWYWASNVVSDAAAYCFEFDETTSRVFGSRIYFGQPVRMVAVAATASPLDSAQAVKDLIDAIPAEITLDAACVNAIQSARDAYNALTEATKGALDAATVNNLNQAITDYTALIQAEADKVIAKIAAIPQPVTLKLATRDSIESARAAYDALTADQKLLVSNYDVLTAAEAELATLNPGGDAGALSGKFTIDESSVVYFSKGNLQATTADLGANWTWSFAANQYDYIGSAAANNAISGNGTVSENGTVDLFGWSTSTTFYGIHNSNDNGTYYGDFVDWSSNTDLIASLGEDWRTLTSGEWTYLLNTRTTTSGVRYAKATVNSVAGLIILPDNWNEAYHALASTNNPDVDFNDNIISSAEWTNKLEAHGAVFLPAAGNRNGTNVSEVGSAGYYWSAISVDGYTTDYMYFNGSELSANSFNLRHYGRSVRLVTENAPASPLADAQAVKDLIEAIPAEITLDAACVKAIEDARAAYDALSDNAKGALDPATVKALTDAEAALTALNQAEADKVVAKINAIPTPVELKLATRDSTNNARAAYEALNAEQKALVPTAEYQKLLDAEDALAALNPGVPPATPLDSAQAVKDLIDAIPTPVEYPTSGAAIGAALVAYNQLSDAAKGALDADDVQKMTDAATQYAALDAIAAIEAIPAEIVYDPAVKAAIETAREKYDALIDASKALVNTEILNKLTNAEEAWAILVAKIEHNVSYMGKDGELKNEKVALLHIPDPAPEFNGYEFVRWDVKAGDFLEEGLRIKAVYTPIITTNPAAYDTLVYNGTAQTLITAGVAKEGHIEYRINDGEWSTELPQATYAAAYVVTYKLVREGHEDYMAGSVNVTIAKAPVTYTAPTAVEALVYNASNQTLIAAGQTNDGTFEYSLDPTLFDSWKAELPMAMGADTYSVYYRVQGDLNHLDSVATDPIAVTIAKAELTATADDKTVTYGDAVPAYTVTYAGWQGDDDASVLTGDIAFACEYQPIETGVGAYVITPSGVSASNYAITFVPGTLTVIKDESHCTAPVAFDTLVYNGIAQTLIIAGTPVGGEIQYSLDPTLSGSWSTALPQMKDAGTYEVFYRVKGDANHNDSEYDPIEVSIAKAPLTITAENKEVVYGYAAPGFSVSYYGLQGSDLPADVLTGELAYACDYTAGSNVALYDIVPSGQSSANYDITYVKGTLTVLKADPAFTVPVANTLTYNGGAQTLIAAGTTGHGTFEYTFTPNDEESWNTALPQAKNADTYGVYYRVVGDHNHLDYESADAVVVTIAKAELTATADNKAVIYGEYAPAFTVSYAGWQGEDNAEVLSGAIAYETNYTRGNDVGNYTIIPSGVDAANYTITFVNGTLTVNRKSAESSDIMAAQAEGEQLVYTNAVNKPTILVKDTTLTLTEEKDYTLSFVGRGETEYTESATAPTHVGEYTAKIAFIGNYKDMLTVDFTISKAQLTITADDKENIFGENAPEFTVSYEGFLGTDTKDVLTGSQAYACEYKRGDNVGDYTIFPSGVDAHDYAITFVNGTLTVNRKSAKDADIVAAQLAGEALVYDAEVNRPTIVVTDTTLTLTEDKDYVLTFIGTANDASVYEESAEAPAKAGDYTAIVAFVGNYIDTLTVDFTVSKAPLTITAEDKTMIYGDEHPEFTVTYAGWQGTDDKDVLLGTQAYACEYVPGSYIGAYSIEPKDVEADNYAITFVNGTLTVNKAVVKVTGADIQEAKFEDGNTTAVVLNAGQLEGIKLNDPIGHVTTATFSDATVGEGKTITMFYELTGDAALLANYDLIPTSEIFGKKGIIIENFIPDNNPEKEDDEAEVKEGIEVYAYGYCDGSGYSLRYHLNSGNPDQYKIDFADSRFTDVDWTNLDTPGKDGTIDIEIPVDLPTGDYTFTATFRDSRFDWLESNPFTVTFHVNLPETYTMPLFENTIALVDTCNCFTDIQWYYRADASEAWQPIPGATGYYYRPEGGAKLTGEYFVKAKMNGVPTFTCPQTDMETLYEDDKQQQKVTVKAFPNPVVNSTTVTIENSENYEHSLRVVNLTGVEMFRTTFEGNETVVRMDGFVQGNYMISVDGIVVKVMKK